MPELPEVETVRRGLAPHLEGRRIAALIVRQPRLRWPVPRTLTSRLRGQRVQKLERRAKYLLLYVEGGAALWHLGMSGSLRVLAGDAPPGKHDHVDLLLDDGKRIRFTDPRRFGALLWAGAHPHRHKLLAKLGPEPLGEDFDGAVLHAGLSGRRIAVKPAIMDSHLVVGVGNIYASEALHRAGLRPGRRAGSLSRPACDRLATAIREVLAAAIVSGGTTLRDFVDGDGQPGYFAHALQVYGRAGQLCLRCGGTIRLSRHGQRASYHCPGCQR